MRITENNFKQCRLCASLSQMLNLVSASMRSFSPAPFAHRPLLEDDLMNQHGVGPRHARQASDTPPNTSLPFLSKPEHLNYPLTPSITGISR